VKAFSLVIAGAIAASLGAPASAAAQADVKQSRYQIGQMERVLEGAVEHGITNIRERLQALGPTELLISNNARARGFRLEGYGMFFDVVAPNFDTVLWSMRTLDQNDLGLQSALRALQAYVKAAGDPNLDQALRRVELQVNPTLVSRAATAVQTGQTGARNVTGAPLAAPQDGTGSATAAAEASPSDPILTDPNGAYRTEVTRALMDALLDHSSSLDIQPNEWLTIGVRRNDDRPQLAPADSDASTFVIRMRGSDLAAFLARQITREEALKRMDVRVF
jgi:hypothetical protein